MEIKSQCPFCKLDSEREIVLESENVHAIFDKFPVSKGHSLIIPKKHVSDYFQLNRSEQSECWLMVNNIKQILDNKFNPDGYNIGINIMESAGQTVPHVHIHVIPRYKGDVKEPRGGVRGVIPAQQNY